jgi:hypothetical protein
MWLFRGAQGEQQSDFSESSIQICLKKAHDHELLVEDDRLDSLDKATMQAFISQSARDGGEWRS